jgi:SAM-dependent methyltransferase
MNNASRIVDPALGVHGRTKDAWTAFWQDPGQSRCVAGVPGVWQSLTNHWSSFAMSLAGGTRVLDLGCGAGAVARVLLAARRDVHVTGIDFARLPLTIYPQVELLSDTAMESLPFAECSFGAVISQFGYEYSTTDEAAREIALVLTADAKLSFLVHHAESSIVTGNRSRLNALNTFLGPTMRAAFCCGDVAGFNAQMSALIEKLPNDTLIAELARSVPSRLERAQQERIAIWNAIEDALAPERCLASSLNANCVAPAEINEWLGALRDVCVLMPVAVLREPNGDPIAWKIEGSRAAASA